MNSVSRVIPAARRGRAALGARGRATSGAADAVSR